MATSHVALRRRALLLTLLLVVAPALAGCIGARDVTKGVRTLCEGPTYDIPAVPAPGSLERRENPNAFVPPFPGVVRVAVLVPSAGDAESMPGARLAERELKEAGAPLVVREVPVTGAGAAAGLAAFKALTDRDPPSVVVSALDADTTDGMVVEAHKRRIPLLATAASADRLVADHDDVGYFFRMMPADGAEGRALAELVWSAGCRSASLVVGPTEKDEDVRIAFRTAFEAKGGAIGNVVSAADAAAAVSRAEFMNKAGKDEPRPEAVVVIAGAEATADVLREAYARKVTARSALFFAEAAKSPALVERAGRDDNGHVLAANLRGTAAMRADTPMTELFLRAYAGANRGVEATNLSLRAYDAVYVSMLAASCARAADPLSVAEKLRGVANANAGDTRVSGAEPAVALTVASQCHVDYIGATHDYDWDARGETLTGRFHVWSVASDGAFQTPVPRFEPPLPR